MDSIAKKIFTLRGLLGFAAALWAVAFVFLGYRRWGCDLPWTSSCMVEFGRRLESGVLFLWVNDWETVFAALLAVAAAGVSIIYLRRQILHQKAIEARRIERRLAAVRAATPLTLSQICDFATRGANAWVNAALRPDLEHHYGKDDAEFDLATVHVFPRLPDTVKDDLKLMIEATSAQDDAPYCALLRRLQVASSRARGYFGNRVERQRLTMRNDHCYGEAAELAEIYARASSLLPSVRDEVAEKATAPSRADVMTAMFSMSIHGQPGARMGEKIQGYYKD